MGNPYISEGFLFWLLFYLWVALEIIFGIRAHLLKQGQPKKKNQDRGSYLLIVIGINLLLWLTFMFAAWRVGMLPIWSAYIGYIVMVMGIGIRFSAILQLGRFFSPVVGVVSNQEIIQSGLYHWIRHPAYTGGWLIMVGIGLSLRTWWGVILCAVGSWLLYVYRIHVEEEMLIQHFGEKYVEYIKTTKRMFPWVW